MELQSEQIIAIHKHRITSTEKQYYWFMVDVRDFLINHHIITSAKDNFSVWDEKNKEFKLHFDDRERLKWHDFYESHTDLEAGDLIIILIVNKKVFFIIGK